MAAAALIRQNIAEVEAKLKELEGERGALERRRVELQSQANQLIGARDAFGICLKLVSNQPPQTSTAASPPQFAFDGTPPSSTKPPPSPSGGAPAPTADPPPPPKRVTRRAAAKKSVTIVEPTSDGGANAKS